MNERTKLVLIFQIPWLVLLIAALVGFVLNYTYSYYPYGVVAMGQMTNWERDPGGVITELSVGLSWVVFFAMAGIPFELWLLYNDQVDEMNAKRKPRQG